MKTSLPIKTCSDDLKKPLKHEKYLTKTLKHENQFAIKVDIFLEQREVAFLSPSKHKEGLRTLVETK